MSFLQDPKIYKTILDSVIKRAQERVARPMDINAVAKKLADNLARELGGASPAENISTAGNSGLTLDNLYSLPSLLQFISLNKLKINGKQVVYTKEEADALADSSSLTQIGELFVDMTLLGQYVNHLLEKAKSESNILLNTSLNNLVNKIKEIDEKFLVQKEKSAPSTADTETNSNQIVNITNLIKSVPLRMRDLSFQRINYFFDQYQKVLGDKRGAGVVAAIANARQAMNNVKNSLNNPSMDLFNLNAGAEEVKTWLKPPQGKYYLAFLDQLESVLANTGYVVRDLQAAYGDDDRLDSNLKNVLGQQIGYGSGSGSIYGNNFSQIMRLKSLVRM